MKNKEVYLLPFPWNHTHTLLNIMVCSYLKIQIIAYFYGFNLVLMFVLGPNKLVFITICIR